MSATAAAAEGAATGGEEAALGAALVAGRPDAQGWLWRRYERLVHHVVGGVMGDRADTEDLAHEVFLRLFTHGRALRRPGSLRAYVVAVASHTARAEIQRRARARRLFLVPESGRLPDVADAGATASASAEQRYLWRLAARALRRLTARERGVVVSRYVEGMTIAETARELRISTATVKRVMKRARSRFLAWARPGG